MFKFLKDKLKEAISKISRKVEQEKPPEQKEEGLTAKKLITEEKPIQEDIKKTKEKETIEKQIVTEDKTEEDEKDEELERDLEELEKQAGVEKEAINEEQNLFDGGEIKAVKKEIPQEKPAEEKIQKEEEQIIGEKNKKGFFSRFTEKITTTQISYEKFESLFSELEIILMENNVAMEVIEKIKNDLSRTLVEKPIKRMKVEETIKRSLRASIEDLFNVSKINLVKNIKNKLEKPFVIAFFGINGSGKTTSIAKIANMLKENKISCVLAASDTFRAASIEQLQCHADKLGIKVIKHSYGSDPAAVAFDAIKHAKAKGIDVVMIDTAGRLHSQQNLMEEMKKMMRVAKPDLKIFVGESITGNDCVEQAQRFNDAVGIDGLMLTKADVDEKGGAAISVSYITKKPIIYLGVGQEYNDLKEFEPKIVVDGLGL